MGSPASSISKCPDSALPDTSSRCLWESGDDDDDDDDHQRHSRSASQQSGSQALQSILCIVYHMGKGVPRNVIPGFKPKSRGIQKESKQRTQRRHQSQTAQHMQTVLASLFGLGVFGKIPVMLASDVLLLCLFSAESIRYGPIQIVILMFMVAHQIRDPVLVRALADEIKKRNYHISHWRPFG